MYQDQIILDGVPLRGARYLEQMATCLARLHDVGTAHDKAGNRQFFCDQYVGLLLLYFFNPTVRTLRGMRKLTDLGSVQRRLKCQRVSLSSLSEAGSAFDAEPVREIFKELSAHMPATRMLNQHHALRTLTAVDGSLLPALPRMVWALWLNEHHHAAKLHLHFEVARGIPVDASITTGQGSEVRQLRQHLQAGRLYVLDRGYACQDLLVDIQAARASYIVRVKECTAFTTARQLPIAPNASAAGVVRNVIVERLGSGHHKRKLFQPVRLVEIQTDASRLMLLTDQLEDARRFDRAGLPSSMEHRVVLPLVQVHSGVPPSARRVAQCLEHSSLFRAHRQSVAINLGQSKADQAYLRDGVPLHGRMGHGRGIAAAP